MSLVVVFFVTSRPVVTLRRAVCQRKFAGSLNSTLRTRLAGWGCWGSMSCTLRRSSTRTIADPSSAGTSYTEVSPHRTLALSVPQETLRQAAECPAELRLQADTQVDTRRVETQVETQVDTPQVDPGRNRVEARRVYQGRGPAAQSEVAEASREWAAALVCGAAPSGNLIAGSSPKM